MPTRDTATLTPLPCRRRRTPSRRRSTTPCASCGRTTSPGRAWRSSASRHDLPDLPATQARLLRNQVDIGNAIKPYYGRAAGNQLTALLKEHIVGAVALLQAAKAGDQALVKQRSAEWYVNGNEIADFLHDANPRNWSKTEMRRMMKLHLDQTLSEAVHRLGGDYQADVRDYEEIHHHILEMADSLSDGIIKQFPRRFR